MFKLTFCWDLNWASAQCYETLEQNETPATHWMSVRIFDVSLHSGRMNTDSPNLISGESSWRNKYDSCCIDVTNEQKQLHTWQFNATLVYWSQRGHIYHSTIRSESSFENRAWRHYQSQDERCSNVSFKITGASLAKSQREMYLNC
jgi:hypothetical protein